MRANKRTTSSAESSSTPPTQKVTLQTFIKNRFSSSSSSSSSTSTSSVNSPLKFALRAGAGAAVGALIGYAAFNVIDERSSTPENVEARILSQRCRNWYMKSTGALCALAVGFDKFIPFRYRAGMVGVGLPLVIYTLKNSNYDIPKNGRRVKVLEERRYKLDDEENVELKK